MAVPNAVCHMVALVVFSAMNKKIRNEKPSTGFDSVTVPGDRGYEKIIAARQAGEIEIEADTVETLQNLI